jgi:hypothetical protein
MQVEPDDVADLALEFRVGGELEGLCAPGLHAEAVPNPDAEAVPNPGDGDVQDRGPLGGQQP